MDCISDAFLFVSISCFFLIVFLYSYYYIVKLFVVVFFDRTLDCYGEFRSQDKLDSNERA